MKWSDILDAKLAPRVADGEENKGDEILTSFQMNLLPAFSRLSVALGTTESDFRLLQSLLKKFPTILASVDSNDDAAEKVEVLVQDTVSTLLKSAAAEGTVSAVLEVIDELGPKIQQDAEDDDKAKSRNASRKVERSFEFPGSAFEVVCSQDFHCPVEFGISSTIRLHSRTQLMWCKIGWVWIGLWFFFSRGARAWVVSSPIYIAHHFLKVVVELL